MTRNSCTSPGFWYQVKVFFLLFIQSVQIIDMQRYGKNFKSWNFKTIVYTFIFRYFGFLLSARKIVMLHFCNLYKSIKPCIYSKKKKRFLLSSLLLGSVSSNGDDHCFISSNDSSDTFHATAICWYCITLVFFFFYMLTQYRCRTRT